MNEYKKPEIKVIYLELADVLATKNSLESAWSGDDAGTGEAHPEWGN